MKITDFKVGEEAYMYDCCFKRTIQVVVFKVVGKYVSVEDKTHPHRFYFYLRNETDNYLYEDTLSKKPGDKVLFASKETLEEELEREKLAYYFDELFKFGGGKQYSLDQLKRIFDITRE